MSVSKTLSAVARYSYGLETVSPSSVSKACAYSTIRSGEVDRPVIGAVHPESSSSQRQVVAASSE